MPSTRKAHPSSTQHPTQPTHLQRLRVLLLHQRLRVFAKRLFSCGVILLVFVQHDRHAAALFPCGGADTSRRV